jgi:hypothetical protein
MFKVQDVKTKKFMKNKIDMKEMIFLTASHAQKWADTATENSYKDATAWNSVRPTKFVVVEV